MTEGFHLFASLQSWISQYGAFAIFVIIMLESFGAPLPGESLLIASAILAGRGELSVTGLLLSAWAGAVIGDNIGYVIGRKFGHTLLRRYGPKVGLTAKRLARIEGLFARYGPATVGFARFVNVLRQFNGVAAGALAMDWWKFLAFNALGGAIWVLAWTSAGYYFGRYALELPGLIHRPIILGAAGLAAVAAIAAAVWAYRRRH